MVLPIRYYMYKSFALDFFKVFFHGHKKDNDLLFIILFILSQDLLILIISTIINNKNANTFSYFKFIRSQQNRYEFDNLNHSLNLVAQRGLLPHEIESRNAQLTESLIGCCWCVAQLLRAKKICPRISFVIYKRRVLVQNRIKCA